MIASERELEPWPGLESSEAPAVRDALPGLRKASTPATPAAVRDARTGASQSLSPGNTVVSLKCVALHPPPKPPVRIIERQSAQRGTIGKHRPVRSLLVAALTVLLLPAVSRAADP